MTKIFQPFPPETHPLDCALNKRVFELTKAGKEHIYLVGGYIRDAILNQKRAKLRPLPAKDFDYAVAGGSAYALARSLAQELNGHFVPLDEKNDTARIVLPDGSILDFAGCLGGDIKSDILRRDFSMNALYWDVQNPDVINDLVGGIADIDRQIVRAICETAFMDDPLRMLRAYRFAASLNFNIEAVTSQWIAKHHQDLNRAACERVNYELFTILAQPQSQAVLNDMAASGILETIFPELSPTRQVTTNAFHHLGLFDHSLETVLQAERLLVDYPLWSPSSLAEELSYGVTRLAATKLACLLHDIGKPATWVVTQEGKHTFIGHDRLGAEMVTAIGERQKWARPVAHFIAKLVKWHLRPGQLFHGLPPTPKAIHKFYRQVADDVPELILLALADLGATQGLAMKGQASEMLRASLIELFKGFDVFTREKQKLERLLDGDDIIRLLEIKPGPLIGEILTALTEAQEFKEVSNRLQAEDFVRKLYDQRRPR